MVRAAPPALLAAALAGILAWSAATSWLPSGPVPRGLVLLAATRTGPAGTGPLGCHPDRSCGDGSSWLPPAAPPTLRFASPPSGLAVQGNALWVSLAGDGVLLKLDLRTGRRLARIDVHRADRRALAGGTLAAGAKDVWVAAPVHVDDDPAVGNASGWIGRIDVRRSLLRITQVYGDPPAEVAVGSAGIWVSGDRTLRRIDARTRRVVASVSLGRYLGAVAVGSRAVWVHEPNAGVVVRIDPRTRKVLRSISIGRSSAGSSLALGRLLWAITDSRVVAIDPATGAVVQRISLPRPSAVAVDGQRVWALASDGLYSISGGQATRTLALGPNTAGLLAAGRGSVWLSDGASNTLRRAPG